MVDEWIQRLKTAYEAGYYQTEAAHEQQSTFPWQGKTCQDCPFWLNEVCRVYAERRAAEAHTCSYFEPGNHLAARRIIDHRMTKVWHQWWEWRERQGQ